MRPSATAAAFLPSSVVTSSISPVAIRATMTARAFTSAGRFSPLGPRGILFTLVLLSGKHIMHCGQKRGGYVMPIAALLQQEAFDPEAIRILTTAFDRAWARFKLSDSALAQDACAPSTRALLAKQIIVRAQTG